MFGIRKYQICCLTMQDIGGHVITCETMEARRADYDTVKLVAAAKCEKLLKDMQGITNVCVSVMQDDTRVFMIASDRKEPPTE